VVGIVCTAGSALSHSAILARSLHLPGRRRRRAEADRRRRRADHRRPDGEVTVDPEADDLRDYRNRVRELAREQRELGRLRSKPSAPATVATSLLANAESPEDVARRMRWARAGWACTAPNSCSCSATRCPRGRTVPAYRDAVLGMSGRPVTIRTLDLGADKADRAGLAADRRGKPALGLRGIRLSLAHPGGRHPAARDPARLRLRPRAHAGADGQHPRGNAGVRRRMRGWPASCARKATRSPTRAAGRDDRSAGRRHCRARFIDRSTSCRSAPTTWCSTCWPPTATRTGRAVFAAASGGAAAAAHGDRRRRAHGVPVAVCGEMAGDATMTPLLLALGLTEFSLHPATCWKCAKPSAIPTWPPCARARAAEGARPPRIERWLAKHAAPPHTDRARQNARLSFPLHLLPAIIAG
jgi:phosphotransferase system enzyme I (PtsI)